MRAILTAALLAAECAIGPARADAPQPHQALAGHGIAADGKLLLIFANRDGDWTIAKASTKPLMACILDFGGEFVMEPEGLGI